MATKHISFFIKKILCGIINNMYYTTIYLSYQLYQVVSWTVCGLASDLPMLMAYIYPGTTCEDVEAWSSPIYINPVLRSFQIENKIYTAWHREPYGGRFFFGNATCALVLFFFSNCPCSSSWWTRVHTRGDQLAETESFLLRTQGYASMHACRQLDLFSLEWPSQVFVGGENVPISFTKNAQ